MEFSKQHLAQLEASQADLWERASVSSTFALSLAADSLDVDTKHG